MFDFFGINKISKIVIFMNRFSNSLLIKPIYLIGWNIHIRNMEIWLVFNITGEMCGTVGENNVKKNNC